MKKTATIEPMTDHSFCWDSFGPGQLAGFEVEAPEGTEYDLFVRAWRHGPHTIWSAVSFLPFDVFKRMRLTPPLEIKEPLFLYVEVSNFSKNGLSVSLTPILILPPRPELHLDSCPKKDQWGAIPIGAFGPTCCSPGLDELFNKKE